ncbi:MAG: methyl-accepting chemotaxis protein [Firmicutes bacterium]|nr:methyl-accepting chemotaxis protein [Bacillota bacterium]
MKKHKKNNKNTNFFSSIRVKLFIIITLVILIPVASIGYLSHRASFNVLEDKLKLTSNQMMEEVTSGLDEYLKGLEAQAYVLGNSSEIVKFIKQEKLEVTTTEEIENEEGEKVLKEKVIKKPDYKESAMELLKNINESESTIANTYIGTAKGDMHIYPQQDLSDGYDPRERPWYKKALENKGKTVWTDPYIDDSSKNTTVTVARTVMENGEVKGVIGIDVLLNELSDEMSSKTIGRTGYIFITSEDGKILSHPTKELIGTKKITEESFWSSVESKEKGFEEYTYKGEKKFLQFNTDEKTGWKIAATMEEKELIKDTNIIKKFVLFSLLGALLLALVISFILSRYIAKPLNKLKEAFNKASNGDLNVEANVNRNDEFGDAANSFNDMIGNIKNLILDVKKASETVLDSSDSLSDVTEQTTTATNEVASSIEEISKNATDQAKDTEDGAAKVNSLADDIERIDKLTVEMDKSSKSTNTLSDKGLDTVKLLTEKSKENTNASMKVNDIVLKVDERSTEISKITETIGQIAEQTNLLALNAAIEAARSGEAGKGFAVVAEEIRTLAEESSKSVEEIKNIVEGIQNQSKEAVTAMENTKAVVKEQNEAVNETENIFKDISDNIKQLTNKVKNVKTNSENMIDKKNEIVHVIENITAAAEETSATTQQVSASSEEQLATMEEIDSYVKELENLAESLKDSTNKFNV